MQEKKRCFSSYYNRLLRLARVFLEHANILKRLEKGYDLLNLQTEQPNTMHDPVTTATTTTNRSVIGHSKSNVEGKGIGSLTYSCYLFPVCQLMMNSSLKYILLGKGL